MKLYLTVVLIFFPRMTKDKHLSCAYIFFRKMSMKILIPFLYLVTYIVIIVSLLHLNFPSYFNILILLTKFYMFEMRREVICMK